MAGSTDFFLYPPPSPAALHRFKRGEASSFHLREPCCLVFSMVHAFQLREGERGRAEGHPGSCSLLYGLRVQSRNKITTSFCPSAHRIQDGGE